ncbi:MAG TPA: cupredoxin domain-containing protein [Sphingomicrobium sp.]|nr:cupredoxin domain-containing protein [Sphingomicrobium sp.]
MRRHSPVAAAAAWALLSVSAPAAAVPRTYTIVVDKMQFGDLPARVRKGDIIVWDNRDIFRHSVTAKGAFDVDLPAGKTVKMRVTRAGSFPFLCKYHPGMKGVLRVAK